MSIMLVRPERITDTTPVGRGSTKRVGGWYITFDYQPKASGKDMGPWPAPGYTLGPPAADPRHEKRGDVRTTEAPVIYSVSCVCV